jgi:hypothetical protein
MAELSDPDKQKKLRMLGIAVRDDQGNFRDFNDIMFDIVAKAGEFGNADFFGTIFGTTSMSAIRAYMTQGERMYKNLTNLGDTTGLLEQKSATMANTLKANLQNLQTAFLSFADKNLTGPLQDLTNLLNKLAENPERVEAAIRGIAIGIGAIAAVRVGAGIVSFIANLKSIFSRGKVDLSGLAGASGGAGMPVYVTNWGGGLPGPGGGQPAGGGLLDQYGKPIASRAGNTGAPPPDAQQGFFQKAIDGARGVTAKQYIGGAATAGITAAFLEIPQMFDELDAIDRDETLTERERSEATGGAIGDAAGSIIGTAAGGAAAIAAGAAIGSVVPVVGTAIGALVGAGIVALGNWLGGEAGRAVGEGIGRGGFGEEVLHSPYYDPSMWVNDLIVTPQGQFSTHPDDYILAMKNPAALVNEVRAVERVSPAIPPVTVNGEIELKSELFIDDKGYRLRQTAGKNTTPYKFTVGSAQDARLIQ